MDLSKVFDVLNKEPYKSDKRLRDQKRFDIMWAIKDLLQMQDDWKHDEVTVPSKINIED